MKKENFVKIVRLDRWLVKDESKLYRTAY